MGVREGGKGERKGREEREGGKGGNVWVKIGW